MMKHWEASLPREHGAWAMFVAPLLVGIGTARAINIPILLFSMTAFGFFLLRYPLMLAIKARSPVLKAEAVRWSALYAAIAGLAGIILFTLDPSLALIAMGAIGAASLAIYLWLASKRSEMSLAGEWIGVAGLVLGAPGAYFIATGKLNEVALALYVLNVLYFGGTIFYVKFRVREQPRLVRPEDSLMQRLWVGRATISYHVLTAALVAGMVAVGVAPALVVLAFIPMFCKAIGGVAAIPQRRLNMRRLGFVELGLTVYFALFLLAAFV